MKRYFNSLFEFSRSFLLSMVHTLLLLPVLYLFLEINDLPGFYSYALFFIVTQIVASLFKKRWLYFLVQFGAVIFFLYRSFPPSGEQVKFTEWLSVMWQYGIEEWSALFTESSGNIPVFLTSVALLLLITLLTYTVVYQKLATLSFLVGMSYLLILFAFTDNDIWNYAIAVVGFGLLLIGLVHIDYQSNKIHFFKTTVFTTVLTSMLIGVAYWSTERLRPVQEWIETSSAGYQSALEERGFFDWIRSQSPQSRYRQIGMDTDDRQLGGPLQNDFTPLFKAYTEEPHYWKVLHRLDYTGSGWTNPALEVNNNPVASPYTPAFSDHLVYKETPEETTGSQESVTLSWNDPLTYIAYPYGWKRLEVTDEPGDFNMIPSYMSGYHSVLNNEQDVSSYTIDYNATFPDQLDEELLKQDDGWREEYTSAIDSSEVDSELSIVDKMNFAIPELVQLPPSLPQRVRDLAAQLTEGLDSEYEMVRAIESYLKSEGDYRYSLRDARETPEGADYVDHFLFETLVGYCDNFSTAMTVMLRSVGIPARWTKGFSQGTEQTDIEGNTYYQITNANAHSWVEVYFPSTGWVPFDPSPSFANPITTTDTDVLSENAGYDAEESDVMIQDEAPETEETTEQAPEPEEEETETAEPSEDDTAQQEMAEESPATDPTTDSAENTSDWLFVLGTAILISLLAALYFFSIHLKIAVWILEKLIQNNKLTMLHACRWTMNLFQSKKKKSASQTFESYFENWDNLTASESHILNSFTDLLNQIFYSPEVSKKTLSSEQQKILIETLQVFKTLPKHWKLKK